MTSPLRTIEEMAREAGFITDGDSIWVVIEEDTRALVTEMLTAFAALIRADAMERAAVIAEGLVDCMEASRANKAAWEARGAPDEVNRLRHASNVSLHNGALKRAAAAIRSAKQSEESQKGSAA